LFCLGAGIACLPGIRCARAQVLAQKNWAGSGVTVELWWKRAVFYRIDPSKFQDSTGNGKGDLAGIAQRLDYLQALGVDAVIVETAPAGGKATLLPTAEVSMAFDTLVREAVGRHVRVLVDLGAPTSQQADAQYVQMARAWLNQGAAGIFIPTPALEKIDGGTHIALLLQQLRALTNSFPGERVLLADAAAQSQDAMLENGLAKYAQLTASAPLGAAGTGGAAPTVGGLRQEWMAALGDTSENAEPAAAASTSESAAAANPGRGRHSQRHETMSRSQMANNPMLVAVRVPAIANPAQRLAMERALAVMLLASRSAVLLEYGQELGLEMAGTNRPLMQWTPTNVTRKPAPLTDAQTAASGAGYQTFQPYVRPLPKNLFPPPVMPAVEEADLPTPEKIAAMPGFTAGAVDAAMVAPNGAAASVVTETYEPRSLLNLYKQLIRLHHDNATVRSGAQTVLNRDDVGALVCVRHAPANSRTSTTVVVACNLSERPVVLTDLGGVALRSMRSLLQPAPGDLMKVEPGAVVVGETR
jgi:glycosidase